MAELVLVWSAVNFTAGAVMLLDDWISKRRSSR